MAGAGAGDRCFPRSNLPLIFSDIRIGFRMSIKKLPVRGGFFMCHALNQQQAITQSPVPIASCLKSVLAYSSITPATLSSV
jgi:ribosomal protein L10